MIDNSNVSSIGGGLFRRDGHLCDLSLDRFEAGELPMRLHEEVVDHLDHCHACGDRWQAMHTDELRLEPPGAEKAASPSRVAAGFLSIAATVVAAAALLLILWPQAQQASRKPAVDGWMASSYTSTSSEFDLASVTGGSDISVFAETPDSDTMESIEDGARVAGDALVHVRLASYEAHYAAVVVSGALNDSEADDGTGGASEARDLDVVMAATKLDLGQTRDAVLAPLPDQPLGDATQRIIVILCAERFSIVAGDDLEQKASAPGCRSTEFELSRFVELADS